MFCYKLSTTKLSLFSEDMLIKQPTINNMKFILANFHFINDPKLHQANAYT